jgi:cytochrome c oxidase accessory protein FixG
VKVYPKRVFGKVRSVKWAVLIACLALYWVTPWIRWDRGPYAPDQAVLVDLANRRFYFFFIEIWPQEFYYVAGLLIMAGLGLFLVTSVAGRVWCGYTCPQTVWTDLYIWVERLVEGDRNARMKLDKEPWGAAKIAKRATVYAIWLLIGVATGGAWIFYFADAPTLLADFLTGEAASIAYITVGVLTATTFVFAGFMREQVCTYMCPWPRIQGAMLDEDSLLVTYNAWRGEPRSRHQKKALSEGLDVGDCVDCNACVAVCPMGIDIRDGNQLECITCALCIDACNGVMEKVGRPKGLIAFETLKNLSASAAATAGMAPGEARFKTGMAARQLPRFIRPRTMMYAGALAAVSLVMLGAFLLRSTLDVTVIRDRAPLFVRLSDGGIRNAFTVKIVNKTREEAPLALVIQAPPGFRMVVQDVEADAEGRPLLLRRADGIAQYRVLVSVPGGQRVAESTPLTFRLLDANGRVAASTSSTFAGPRP